MPAPPDCLYGRIMKFLTFFLLLPETLKRTKKGGKQSGKLPVCYEIVTLSLKKKMAAELYPASINTNLPNSNDAAVTAASKKSIVQVTQTVTVPTTTATQQNINNNNVETSSWQSTHPTLRERNALMFNNEHMADVHFIVGPPGESQKVPAHKYVLAVGSSVFGAMFYGDLAEGESEIHIPDVEPAAFLILLKYMYSDEIELEADTVLATLYAAKKYIVPALAKACVTFLETSLEAKNACVLLSQSRLFEEPDLTQRCWEVIDAQAELALRSDGFCEIDLPTLEIILRRETLNTREAVVFQAVLDWAVAECRRQGLGPTARNKRAVLGKALYMVRVPTMTLAEFADGAAQSDVLTLEETHDVFLWYTAANKPELDFPLAQRTGLTPQRCHRFQSSAYRSNQWRYRGRCDSIQFAVDKRIFIAGLGLYGSSGGKAEYSVRIELKRQGTTLAQNLTTFVSDGSSSTFSVWFEHPVQVEQDAFYTVSAVLDGNELSYFGQEGMTEVQCGKVTFQFQCSSDSTNGTGVQGGQIPELVFYA
ncbi:BTB/POZ domain-containing protein 6-B isoform X1 [Hypomesus transpacificus]|uniref:BTB/POZ domain-containing protein 6-B isoform X1 n=2 Tax=Hypomesus transpacificus TaxID=137520 RepID=UPI001F07DD1B|nr:BTB/POZ domain-containing protein 6-B isoform X1 [Hypomesus transpacificus]